MLISNAYAQAASPSLTSPEGLMGMLPLILMFVVLYFLMIRPQMKKAKEHKTMTDALTKGDEIITQGGVVGRVVKVGDAYVHVEVSEGSVQILQKAAVQTLLPKGTIKAL